MGRRLKQQLNYRATGDLRTDEDNKLLEDARLLGCHRTGIMFASDFNKVVDWLVEHHPEEYELG